MQTQLRLLHTWQAELDRLLPDIRATRRHGFAVLVAGLLWAGTVSLPRIAESLVPLGAKVPSIERRLRRWLANPAVEPEALWRPLLPPLLARWAGPHPRLVLDPTDLPGRHRLLVLGLVVRERVLPVAWRWLPNQHKWEQRLGEIVTALAPAITAALPPGVVPTVIADAGLSGPRLLGACVAAGWHYVLRLPLNHNSSHQVRLRDGREGRLWTLVTGPGQHWHGAVDIFKGAGWIPVHLTIHWDVRHKRPWILIADTPGGRAAVATYRRRSHTEATFQDTKSRIWHLPVSKLTVPARLARLVVAVVQAMWWAATLALTAIRRGTYRHYDRGDRHDLGLCRLGRLLFACRALTPHLPTSPFRLSSATQTVRE